MTSSILSAGKGCLVKRGLPAATKRSEALKVPGFPRALRNGVRAPSTTYTFLFFYVAMVAPHLY